jgi:hypothetical protein
MTQNENANDTVTGASVQCPLCEEKHLLKRTGKDVAFFSCSRIGSGTNVFFRTELGKQKLRQWASHATHVPLRNEAAEDRTSVPSTEVKKTLEEYPADEAEDPIKRLIKEWSSSTPRLRPVRRHVRR